MSFTITTQKLLINTISMCSSLGLHTFAIGVTVLSSIIIYLGQVSQTLFNSGPVAVVSSKWQVMLLTDLAHKWGRGGRGMVNVSKKTWFIVVHVCHYLYTSVQSDQ